MSTTATIITDTDEFDTLSTWNRVLVTSRQLREGMVIVDADGFSCEILDHRIGPVAGGCVAWLCENLIDGGWHQVTFPVSRVATIPVAAGLAA